jgi:2-polyprenyl-3-methyl-5-hydroxy-6-metoxy-1,4-benzoquinol methylase
MLTKRSQEKELLDLGPDNYTPQEFQHCQKMPFKVNKLLGGFRDTVNLLRKFPATSSLLDIGCGGGLFLLNLGRFLPEMQLVGTDISDDAIQLAEQALKNWHNKQSVKNVTFQLQPNAALSLPPRSVDIILTTMVCHHLSDEELIQFMRTAFDTARSAVIINDLHRHFLAEWFYQWLSPILFRNRLITHDGLISIRRGFKRKEWRMLLQQANITTYQIQWRFPFRWRVVLWKK